jgi:hypothetical protein
MFVGPGQWPGVDLPPSDEQELVEMHSPVGLFPPIVHVLPELGGGGLGVEVQHFEAVSSREHMAGYKGAHLNISGIIGTEPRGGIAAGVLAAGSWHACACFSRGLDGAGIAAS